MKKSEIIQKIMESEYWEDVYVKYTRIGLEHEKKKVLLEILESQGQTQE